MEGAYCSNLEVVGLGHVTNSKKEERKSISYFLLNFSLLALSSCPCFFGYVSYIDKVSVRVSS